MSFENEAYEGDAFNCFFFLVFVCVVQVQIDTALPSCSINQKASAVGALGAENVWRGLAYNVLEAVQAPKSRNGQKTNQEQDAVAEDVNTQSDVSNAETGNAEVSLTASTSTKKQVSFTMESDSENSDADDDEEGSSKTAAASGDADGNDMSVGLSRVLGLSDTNVALQPCQIELISSARHQLCSQDNDLGLLTMPVFRSPPMYGSLTSGRSRVQHVRYLSREGNEQEVDLDALYLMLESSTIGQSPCSDHVVQTKSDSAIAQFYAAPCLSAQPSEMPLATYLSLCQEHLKWCEGDIQCARWLYEEISESGWRGLSLQSIHHMKVGGRLCVLHSQYS